MARKRSKDKGHKNNFALAGFFRINITDKGKLVGDSGWMHNVITDYGLDEGIGRVLVGAAGSIRVGYAALGTGTAPATNHTTLDGEGTGGRDVVTTSVVTSASGAGITARWYGTFASSESRFGDTVAIQNIGLFETNTGGTVFCGAQYTVSTLATNQDVNYTYEWRFATTS
jgi:hypothetical protein